jgi:hypothetical protein
MLTTNEQVTRTEISVATLDSWSQGANSWLLASSLLTQPPYSDAGHPRLSDFFARKGSSALLREWMLGAGLKGSPEQSPNHQIRSHCWWSPRPFAGVPVGPPCYWCTLTAREGSLRWDPQEVCHWPAPYLQKQPCWSVLPFHSPQVCLWALGWRLPGWGWVDLSPTYYIY